MNFLAKAASTVNNAIEINNLKAKREKLTKEKLELELCCAQYDQQINLMKDIQVAVTANANVITILREKFVNANITYDIDLYQFLTNYKDNPDMINCKKIYDQLIVTNKALEQPVLALNHTLMVPRDTYIDKLMTVEDEIDKINEKLKVVRDKQYGKKN